MRTIAIGYFAIGLVFMGMADADHATRCPDAAIFSAPRILAGALIWGALLVSIVVAEPEVRQRRDAQALRCE